MRRAVIRAVAINGKLGGSHGNLRRAFNRAVVINCRFTGSHGNLQRAVTRSIAINCKFPAPVTGTLALPGTVLDDSKFKVWRPPGERCGQLSMISRKCVKSPLNSLLGRAVFGALAILSSEA